MRWWRNWRRLTMCVNIVTPTFTHAVVRTCLWKTIVVWRFSLWTQGSRITAHALKQRRAGTVPLLGILKDGCQVFITRHCVLLVFSTYINSSMDFLAFGVFIHIKEFKISQEKHLSSGFQKINPQKTSFLY